MDELYPLKPSSKGEVGSTYTIMVLGKSKYFNKWKIKEERVVLMISDRSIISNTLLQFHDDWPSKGTKDGAQLG